MEYLTFFENTHKKIFFYRRIVLKVVLYYFQIVNLFFFGKKERYHEKDTYLEYFRRIWKENKRIQSYGGVKIHQFIRKFLIIINFNIISYI